MVKIAADIWNKLTGVTVPALIPVCLGILSLCLGIFSLYLVIKNYRRKSGAYVRGSFGRSSSRDCDEDFVYQVVLENLKDRSVTIFGIYLRLGYNNYLEIEKFDDKPVTLKPFETYMKTYGPIEFYSMNCEKIAVGKLLSSDVKKTLFLATSDGKYKVKTPVLTWSPLESYFANHFTAIIHPERTTYRGKAIGGNIKFIVDIEGSDESVESINIFADSRHSPFKHFALTRESLASKESLEEFLRKQIESGKLTCKKFTVLDLEAWRAEKNKSYKGKGFEARALGRFQYYVLGRLFTIYQNSGMARKNRELTAKARQKQMAVTEIPINSQPTVESGAVETHSPDGSAASSGTS